VHGPSVVVDHAAFAWTDSAWGGITAPDRQVVYELHLGTFSPEGNWAGAAARLPVLAELGVTTVEVLPVNAFPGRFGWGYDGVQWFAPSAQYGAPDDMRRFVDRAHALGLAVVLDVVYNHFGPDGNYSGQFSPHYVNPEHTTDWGDAINYDGAHAGPVREFVAANGRYWVEEFRVDGLRLDATHAIVDASPVHVLAELGAAVRAAAARLGGRRRGSSTRTSRSAPRSSPPPPRAGATSTRSGTTTGTTAPTSGSRCATRRTSPTTAARRASSWRRRSTASSTRGSGTSGSGGGAARRRSAWRRGASCTSSRTTTRWPTPAWASGCTR
jgi:malto-oligosyltrehalose trehalohydrolase